MCLPDLNGLLGDSLPREVGDDLIVLMEQELAPSGISEQVSQVPETACGNIILCVRAAEEVQAVQCMSRC